MYYIFSAGFTSEWTPTPTKQNTQTLHTPRYLSTLFIKMCQWWHLGPSTRKNNNDLTLMYSYRPDILVAMGVIKISLHTIYEQPTPIKIPLNYRHDVCTVSWTHLKRKCKFHTVIGISLSFYSLISLSFSLMLPPILHLLYSHCITTYIHELMFVSKKNNPKKQKGWKKKE